MGSRSHIEAKCTRKWRRIAFVAIVAVVAVLSVTTASAQTFYGSIVGSVTDNTGAVVPGATVTITNIGTNEVRTAKSSPSGDFSFINLVPSNYKVDVQMANFKRFVRASAQVAVNSTIRVDAKLEIGATTETVEVTTNAPLLQTESGSLGDTVGTKQVEEMPLNGRNTLNLMQLVPGVVPQGTTQSGVAMNQGTGTGSVAWGNYQIGGGMPSQASIFVDGSPTMIMQKNSAALVPTADTIQEFQVQTSGVSPEFGRFGGGVVSMTTKSGTNAFHGTAYEYIRNRVLNANTFFNKRSGVARGQNNQNQFGGTVGGPIWKNKAFFFFAYEQIHIRASATSSTNVPTAGMVNGTNIPEVWINGAMANKNLADTLGNCIVTHPVVGTASSPGYFSITNLYQGGCGDTTTKIFASFYPTTPKNPNAVTNWNTPYSQGNDGYQMSGRVDYNITKNNRFFTRFTLWPLNDKSPNIMGVVNPKYNTVGAASHNHTNNIVAGDTITLTPTMVLDIRADYLRQYGDSVSPSLGSVNEADFGTPFATLSPTMNYHAIPAFTWGAGQVHNLFQFSYAGALKTWYNNYHLSASVTKIAGKHSLKIGAEARLMNREDLGTANSGTFAFNNDIATATANLGDEWASFLMGQFDTSSIGSAKRTTTYNFYTGYYVADIWQVNNKLTLNYGLRLEAPGGYAEAGNNAYVLQPTTADPVTGVMGTLGLVNSTTYAPKYTLNTVSPQVGPRVGFAYRLNSNTVIRGGYSYTYLSRDTQTGPFGGQMSINSTTSGCTNTATAGAKPSYTVASNPFVFPCSGTSNPQGMAIAAGRNQLADKTNFMYLNLAGGSNINGSIPNEPAPYSQQMNVSIGRQLKGDTLIDVGFAHSLGVHLATIGTGGLNAAYGINQLPSTYFICGGVAYASAPQCNNTQFGTNLPTASKVSVTTPLGAVLLPNALQVYGQAQRPFPYYKNVSNTADYHGTSSYNALEVKVQKRFHAAGQIGAAYTWMKMITNTDSFLASQDAGNAGVWQDFNNPKGERSLYSYNIPHRLIINYVLNLPFGKGQRFGATSNPIASRVISGWSVSGMTSFQSGAPLHLSTTGNKLSSTFGAGTIRPNYTAGCTKTNGGSGLDRSTATAGSASTAKWFNTACFTLPATPGDAVTTPGTSSFAFGNEPRVDGGLKASGVDNFDMSIVKNTTIHEQIGLKFTVEFFNLFNRVQFAPPNVQAGSTNFGLVTATQNSPRIVQGALRLNF